MNGFKGFDKDMKCRGMQFEVGQAYEVPEAVLCEKGLHFCEHPLDCFGYYAPGDGSRYCEIKAAGTIADGAGGKNEDTKRAATKITIVRELTLTEMIVAAAKKAVVEDRSRKVSGAATASGYSGAATASGTSGAATASGYSGAATASGYRGAATASGDSGAATASGYRGAATASGYRGAATASGDSGAATASGTSGAATASGDRGAATASGYECIACALGVRGRARGSIGNWIVVAQRNEGDDCGHIEVVLTAKVDGATIKADTWYTARGGVLVEVA